ncbi:MAG: alpha/beta fold hydrolase [Sphingorhabdus sp.]|jgi:polyhydroxyalkanoate synthase subunit PhaC|uniref:PHA/PHB synthase family protein n=1 Tax=Sphingorhabdus sp. TaxID=1902408 RepID=UPI00273D8E5E|nr:alpha/beta fold hydrolase [Sphingorhabdus sp.]MDP4756817.1 alpha/beta fold hydrolase [Sphingorhabdus sp.]MDP4873405.1 alpha/beta fold hydrolase [Sphingorhabdus sp.]MDP4926200.1 alpha/beta fold hydrolase [Sphingorhabdus sp.]
MADSSNIPPFMDADQFMKLFGQSAVATTDPLKAYRAALDAWGAVLEPLAKAGRDKVDTSDRRFTATQWEHPVFDLVRQSYQVMSEYMLTAADQLVGLADHDKAKMDFALRSIIEAMSPANSPFTNPVALERAMETNGASLISGMQNLIQDMQRGQITHTDPTAFKLGENIAATKGKVVHQTPLYQLIQYDPTTEDVLETPLIIFPPWINRFYILDLTAEKSFIKYCVDQGITVFVVSWKSADSTMKDIVWDDYIAAQIDAIDTVCSGLDVPDVHAIGYCVAGTTLAATLSILAATDAADKVRSATFFTAQVDFSTGGELLHFIDDQQIAMMEALSAPQGYMDGRFLALTFNMLRGKDLIWSTVVKNYLLGEDYPAFDLLHWNGDVTNLPAKWHRNYVIDLYRDNRLVKPDDLSALGTPIDLRRVKTATYIQAGREDHIAPAESVWKLQDHFTGPMKFVLAGSGHIAGVVNPPAQMKYQYWTNNAAAPSLDAFIEGATETKGSWWPDWIAWLTDKGNTRVPATGGRQPGQGTLKALESAPGSYVKAR